MTAQDRFLCFNLGPEEFAIPLLNVKEVIGVPDTTPVPQSPAYFIGIMNLRGEVLSVLDLRTKLGIAAQFSQETATIILELEDFKIGVLVDRINSVQTFTGDSILEKPVVQGGKAHDCITGVVRRENRLTLVLDIFKTVGELAGSSAPLKSAAA